jgi:hypothetical protein
MGCGCQSNKDAIEGAKQKLLAKQQRVKAAPIKITSQVQITPKKIKMFI